MPHERQEHGGLELLILKSLVSGPNMGMRSSNTCARPRRTCCTSARARCIRRSSDSI